jgi:hypothetical protein
METIKYFNSEIPLDHKNYLLPLVEGKQLRSNNVFKIAPFGRWDHKAATRLFGPLTLR